MASTRQDASNGTTISPLRVFSRRPKNSKEISVNGDKDLFRNLPDEMLITILSFLDTKTAISTCILSKRWRNLFLSLTHFDLTLHNPNFAQNPNYAHDKKISPFILNWEERSLVKGEKIIQFIKTIQALLNPKIKSLFIEFKYFDQTYIPFLDECVLNALSGNLNHFELRVRVGNYEDMYTFPLDSLDEIGDSLEILHLSDCALIPDSGFLAFKSLKKLTLTGVIFYEPDIEIEDLEEFLEQVQERFSFLINGCLTLEILSLNLTKDDIVKIDAPFSKLKEIELNGCGISEIVCAPKLENLVICDSEFVMNLKPIPSLKYLKLGFKDDLSYKLSDISFVAPCLETLVLYFEDQMVWLEPERCFGSFMKLRSLVIEAKMDVICNPFWIGLLLEAATNLEKFEINNKANKFSKSFEEIDQQHKPFNFKLKNLKEFKVVGFKRGIMKKNLIKYIIDSATALEKIILINNDGKYEEFDATQFSSF